MDLFQIISDIEKVDPEVYERFDTRRKVFKNLSGLGKTVTAAALPALVGTMFRKAYGQTSGLSSDIVNTLNLALSLEYLEYYYYAQGVRSGLFSGNDLNAITIIRDDELGHINLLKATLGSQAIPIPTEAAFDYTAGGRILPFSSAALFLGTAQAFVDTGVRAYKGGAPFLMSNKDILTAALNIHSVEARHSSHIRTMRRGGIAGVGQDGGGANDLAPKSWVSLQENDGPAPPLTAPVYAGSAAASTATTKFAAESNVSQGPTASPINVQTTTVAPTGLTISAAAASEAFDEPLDADSVKIIARNFRSAVGIAAGLFA
jgi:hypothetical protein